MSTVWKNHSSAIKSHRIKVFFNTQTLNPLLSSMNISSRRNLILVTYSNGVLIGP